MKLKGVRSCCFKNSASKFGRYKRNSDGQWVQRYQCKHCKKTYSRASFKPEYNQNKRQINHLCMKLLASGVSMRRTAKLLKVHRITVARKLEFLSKKYSKKVFNNPDLFKETKAIQFDELQTIEHTKCKPVSVAVAVSTKTQKVLGLTVSKMPATGYLSSISRKKYGVRQDERLQGLRSLFDHLQERLSPTIHIESDECSMYRGVVNSAFPKATYQQFKGLKASPYGLGELKKSLNDPLFSINHTFAMFRANISRLIRRTWNTTKKIPRLLDHLIIFCWVFNRGII